MKGRSAGRWTRVVGLAVGVTAAVIGAPGMAAAQELADLDYEHLEFRGIGLEIGYLFPTTRVERAPTFTVNFDMGYLGPGLRIAPSFTYWSAPFRASEVATLEDRVASLVSREAGFTPDVDLGTIEWANYSLGLDAHVVWAMPFNLLSFGGLGISAHVMDGSGAAIEGTFIEDLLDSVSAGFNLHLGLEYPVSDQFRIRSIGRYAVMEDMQYFSLGLGGHILWGRLVPGEERRR